MELTRRQFIISSSAVASAITLPHIFISSIDEINYKFSEFKDFTFEQVQDLDKYVLSSIIPSLMSMLIIAYTLELLTIFSSLLILLLSLIVLI
tara:strand:- start:271 stop:549 length:279 start_codon:yes stop_codon:yes gene_type:complete